MSIRSRLLLPYLAVLLCGTGTSFSQARVKQFEDSLVVAPLYAEYLTQTDEQFAQQAAELKQRVGTAPHILLGFASFLYVDFPAQDLNEPVTPERMASTLRMIDRIVERARRNDIVVHISIVSGFFHGMNDLRRSAIRQDVRNAQWFADGWIAEPAALVDSQTMPSSVWTTPSRYARLLRSRMEEGIRMVGSRLAKNMVEHPETLLTISGDGEVELTYERNFDRGERAIDRSQPLYADYSPFMVQEFRDWIRHGRYDGDLTPMTDDNRDGKTFDGDFGQTFTTWQLRYFDSSGPISYSTYRALPEKLPSSGPYFAAGGFDAPRSPKAGGTFWQSWMQFRTQAIANYVRDFATWITTSRDPDTGFTVPAPRFYSHQIPADFLFGETQSLRLLTSGSSADTAMIAPIGSTGVTVFNAFDGSKSSATATPALFERLSKASVNWGVFEYNPSVPVGKAIAPSTDLAYYLAELRTLYSFRPHVVVPFAWSDRPDLSAYRIKNRTFETALKRFVVEVGDTPWSSRDSSAR